MTDAEKPTADHNKSDVPKNAIRRSDSANPYEETHILGEEPVAETMPPVNLTSVESAASADSRTDSEPEVIHYFGNYELLDEIARGGMGVVYKARQSGLKRIVAVKMILGGQLASEQQVRRFLIEAEAAANLDHPGIVPVYEFGEHDGAQYFSMAYVDGPSLAEIAGENPLPSEQAADLLVKMAEAVAYAHRRGVVHRDLKPANVLIGKDGDPRITDFGLAKMIDADDELTQDGAIMGSVFYMAPEQAAGKSASIGPPADIYALGAIFYKLLTGNSPFQAPTTMEILNQVVNQEPVPPRRVNPRIPRDLETICLKCLQKDISRRFRSTDELVEELGRFQRGEPIQSRPISRFAHAWRWCHRNPLAAGLGTGLCAAVLLGVIAATTLMNRTRSEQRRFEQQQRTVEVLSSMVLGKSLDETEEWLRLFFQPVEQQLLIASDWTRDTIINPDQPQEVNRLLIPMIEHYPQISSMMIADQRGREHMLLGIRQPQPGNGYRQWKCRQTRRDEWQDQVKWYEWIDDQLASAEVRTERLEYDPRTRPWFQGAVAKRTASVFRANARHPIHWTEPYVFFTTKELGITASMTAPLPEDEAGNTIVAFDVLLEDITRFTMTKHPTPLGKVFVLTQRAELVGLPNDGSLRTPEQWRKLFLKPLAEFGRPYALAAANTFSFSAENSTQIRSFQSERATWWGAAKPFELGNDLTFWILVLLPESDLHKSLSNQ